MIRLKKIEGKKQMKSLKNKTKISIIAFVLMLTFAVSIFALPTVTAHDPAWQTPTWAFLSVAPNPIGAGQQIIIVMWLNDYPRTAIGKYGDRWDGMYLDITKPDGSKQTLGPFTSDPVGTATTNYVPDQVGTYTFVFRFEGDTLTGEPAPPGGIIMGGEDFIGDVYLPSTSDPVTLTVQQDPIPEYLETPLPEGYWTRPIYGANREWYKVAGNWLAGAAQNVGSTTRFGYGTGPESAHIMWARQYWDGGIMDTRTGDISYYDGMSYETYGLTPPIILNGRLYYDVLTPPRYGWYCIDLRTGEELYFHNTTGPIAGTTNHYPVSGADFDFSGVLAEDMLTFGQVYDYESPNQHGGFPYLWSNENVGSVYGGTGASTTWKMFDAFTGNYICTIANVSMAGTMVYGKDGSILFYNVDTVHNRLTVWNTSQAIWYRTAYVSNQFWMWRPYLNQTFDGNYGFSLDVSIPSGLPGRALAIVEGQYIIGGTPGRNTAAALTKGNMWAISLQPGQEGRLLWQYDFVPPQTGVPDPGTGGVFGYGLMALSVVSPEDGVFVFTEGMTRRRWGFDLATGNMLWGPTEPTPSWDYYGLSTSVYDGKIFSYGYGGVLVAYDIQTGEKLWSWSSGSIGLETFYENAPLNLGCFADGKIYLYSSEHSPSKPLRRDANMWCVDTTTGELLWKIQCWGNNPAIGDGYLVALDSFDNRIYCYGKGPSATTVSVKDDSVAKGEAIMVTGTVTDQSAGAKGTPAIADANMEGWMEYLYQQRPMPADAQGVTVKLYAIDPNCNYQDIGEVTSDIWGNYGKSWVPPVEGEYLIIAEFAGSASYGGSSDSTYITVGPAVSAAQPIETEEPTAFALGTTELAIIAVVIIAIIGVVAFMALRKRK
jgi:hypothetical protein